MKLETSARDCLFLNWALPVTVLPEAPRPLRFETHEWQGASRCFVSALCFRHHGTRLAALPLLSFSHEQLTLAFYVLDEEGVPSVLFWRNWVPGWAAPLAWLLGRRASRAGFRYPRTLSPEATTGAWNWRVRARGSLEVRASLAAPTRGEGPHLGSFQAEVSHFRLRRRAYVLGRGGLAAMTLAPHREESWPIKVELGSTDLLERTLPAASWPGLHSAFLGPDTPLLYDLVPVPELPSLAPARSSVATDPAMLASALCERDRFAA
ncbi:MAG: DUF2071 domain-containing protein [Thermoanaerobaculia bacterium]